VGRVGRETPADCLRISNVITPGAVTDGLVTDGVVSDGAVTDGAVTDGAITDGTISYDGAITVGEKVPNGTAKVSVNGMALTSAV
jgi:hypothetical protein